MTTMLLLLVVGLLYTLLCALLCALFSRRPADTGAAVTQAYLDGYARGQRDAAERSALAGVLDDAQKDAVMRRANYGGSQRWRDQ